MSRLLSDDSGETEININTNKIIFFIKNTVLISKLIDGNFPDYKKVIPTDNSSILHVNRSELSSAVDRVSTITSEKSPTIKFRLLKNLLNMTSANNENGTATEDIKIKYEGTEMEIGFNSKYILEMINNLQDDEIILTLKDNSSPITATEKSNPDLIYVLMPMRV